MKNLPDSLCSSLQHLVRNVMFAKFGICSSEVELEQLTTGRPGSDKRVNVAINDRFKLKIPISDELVTWEVMFNGSLPNCPPDFDLNDLDFFYSMTLDMMEEMIPSLKYWDCNKEKSLINVISELRSAYLRYQVEKLKNYRNQCSYEYETLINNGNFTIDQVEVLTKENVIHLLIKLDIDFRSMIPKDEEFWIVLVVLWSEHSRNTRVEFSQNLSELDIDLELHRKINIDDTLSEYVEEVSSYLQNEVNKIESISKNKKKEYIFELLKCWGHSLIQFDAMEYRHCSFLMEKDGFVCIMEVTLPVMFPIKQPQFRLLSSYSTSKNGKPLSKVISVPHDQSWNITTMLQQAKILLEERKIPMFMKSTESTFRILNKIES